MVHRCRIRTTVSASTQTAETTTTSVKVWRVHEVKPDGSVTFDHMVESVDMRHRLSGRDEVHYNSRTDLCPPHGFEDVARAIGVPLAVVTNEAHGKVIQRKQNFVKAAVAGQGEITIQLPEQAVAVGSQWSSRNNLDVPLADGSVKRLRVAQTFKLENVKTGVATISMSTQILTPIQDPAIEAQVLQYETAGTLRFDIEEAGRFSDARSMSIRASLAFAARPAASATSAAPREDYLARRQRSPSPASRQFADPDSFCSMRQIREFSFVLSRSALDCAKKYMGILRGE